MIAYKFLADGRVGPFSSFAWPRRKWVEATVPDPCRTGVHACLRRQLAYWLAHELWEVELDGKVIPTPLKLVAQRGRLERRITAWDDGAKREFALECVRRTALCAAAELRDRQLTREAERLEAAAELEELEAVAMGAGAAAAAAGATDAATLAAYVVDAAAYAKDKKYALAGPAFVAAHAADVHDALQVEDPFVAEREDQGLWLARRLGLNEESA